CPLRCWIVARPAARRFRTQCTSPQGAQTQRPPETSRTAIAAVRGTPVVRPRIVTSRLYPSGTRATRRALRIGLKSRTEIGTRATGPDPERAVGDALAVIGHILS